MDYLKGILSALVAIILAELVPGSWSVFRGISKEKATGLAAVLGGLVESLLSPPFSPVFWIFVMSFFALFFASARSGNKLIRIFFFWIPTLTVSSLTVAIVGLFTYLFVSMRNR